jgi:hypothetical protein
MGKSGEFFGGLLQGNSGILGQHGKCVLWVLTDLYEQQTHGKPSVCLVWKLTNCLPSLVADRVHQSAP